MTSRRRFVGMPITVAALLADMRSHPAVICVHAYAVKAYTDKRLGICANCEATLRAEGWKPRRSA